jgi:hypothetical protein
MPTNPERPTSDGNHCPADVSASSRRGDRVGFFRLIQWTMNKASCRANASTVARALISHSLSIHFRPIGLPWQFSAEFARIMMALGQTVKHAQKMLGILRAAMLGAQALASKGEGHDGVAAGTCHVEYGS